jgi:hypothetical protein
MKVYPKVSGLAAVNGTAVLHWVQLYRYFVTFAAITLCGAPQRVFIVIAIVYFVIDPVRKLLDTSS